MHDDDSTKKPRPVAGEVQRRAGVCIVTCAGGDRGPRRPHRPSSLDQILKDVATYDGGIESDALWKLRDYVYARKDSPAGRAECEQALLGFLKTNATPVAKMTACRYLRLIAGDTAIPPLEAMLAEAQSADMALYALQQIPGAAAEAALVRAVKTRRDEDCRHRGGRRPEGRNGGADARAAPPAGRRRRGGGVRARQDWRQCRGSRADLRALQRRARPQGRHRVVDPHVRGHPAGGEGPPEAGRLYLTRWCPPTSHFPSRCAGPRRSGGSPPPARSHGAAPADARRIGSDSAGCRDGQAAGGCDAERDRPGLHARAAAARAGAGPGAGRAPGLPRRPRAADDRGRDQERVRPSGRGLQRARADGRRVGRAAAGGQGGEHARPGSRWLRARRSPS